MDVRLPDGTMIQNVPDDMSKADFTAKLKSNGYDVSKLETPAPKRERHIPGDAGSLMSSGEALDALNKLVEHFAYKGGEKVSEVASKVLPPEGAAAAGTVANLGIQAGPMLLGGEAMKAVSPAIRSGAEWMMKKALKPGVESIKNGEGAKAIQTLLDEGINVTKGGVQKLQAKISALNDDIVEAIKNSPATVDKNKVAGELYKTIKKFENQVTPGADVKAIENAWTEFLGHPLFKGGSEIPVQTAQELKQGTYRVLKGKYGEQGSAATEAQKTLARGLKEGIAEAVPGVADLNAKESALIRALELTERRAHVAGNNNPMGLSLLAKNPEAWAAFMADRSSAFKSIIARMINANQRTAPQAVGNIAGATVGAVSGQPQ